MNTKNEQLLNDFINTKILEGCSEKSMKLYRYYCSKFLIYIGDRDVTTIDSSEIKQFLVDYKGKSDLSNVTLNNIRSCISSFYDNLAKEKIILSNPCDNIKKIKVNKIIKKAFSPAEIVTLRMKCQDDRERAILEILYSTGMRIGELEKLNKVDIDWNGSKVKVFGKGGKERFVYLNEESKAYLKKYLEGRKDDNEALFVGKIKPHNRISIDTYETILKKLGNRCDIHCHPHKFRRTCATNLLLKGMPIHEVSKILGHESVETTMIYCDINQEDIQYNYKKYMN